MNLQSIIENLADRADELLVDVKTRKEAQSAIGEILTQEQPKMNGVDRQKVTAAVVEILDEEGFFEQSASRDWDDGTDDEEE